MIIYSGGGTNLLPESEAKIMDIPTVYISIGVLGSFLVFTIIATFDAKYYHKSDYLHPVSIITVAFELLDTILDVVFALFLCLQYLIFQQMDILVATGLSFVFIIMPIGFSIYQLIRKENKSWFRDDDLQAWLLDHSWKLLALSILCGSSYAAIELVNCGAFGLEIFNMGLNKQQRIKYNTKRIFGVVCLEVKSFVYIQIYLYLF